MTDPNTASTERLEAIEERLEQSQRLVTLGTLAAGVAHEINNILTPVLSYAHMAKSSPADQVLMAKALNKIISGVESACSVAQATLNYSQDRDEDETAEVGETLDAALECLARCPEKDGFQIQTRIPPATMVRIRPLALQQAILNLVLNARTALRAKKGVGTVQISATENPGSQTTTITISDDGPGIAADLLAKLFDPFVSTNSNQALFDSSSAGGAGLGLTVTRHLIEKAGGTIWAESQPGAGATFTITLPTARGSHAKAG